MLTPTFQVNVPEFIAALNATIAATKRSLVDEYRRQAKFLFERIINWKGGAIATPPKNVAQGKAAVKRDIYRAVFPLRAEGFNDVKLRKKVQTAIDNRNDSELRRMARAGVFGEWVKPAIVGPFFPNLHQSQRKSRGRVGPKQHYKFATRDVKGMAAYVKTVQARVGQGKGGWAAALIRLGGKPAAWIAKHAGVGRFIDNLQPGRSEMVFTGINRSAWASGGDEDRIIAMAMEGRAMSMKAALQHQIAKEWGKRRAR